MATDQLSFDVEKSGVSLNLEFVRQADRFGHEITVGVSSEVRSILRSVDRPPAEPGVASPPLQQVSIEPRGESQVALALGMSGKSHWSLSVETMVEPVGLEFDAACRVDGSSTVLGSTYRWGEPAEGMIAEHDETGNRVVFRWKTGAVVVAALAGTTCRWESRRRLLAMIPTGDRATGLIRWKYRVYLP